MQPLGFWQTAWADFSVISTRRHSALYFIACLITRSGFLAVFLYRIAALCSSHGTPLFYRIATSFFWRINILLNSCDISPRAIIGPGLKMPHPVGIVIGHARVGRNAMFLQNSSLGMRWFTDDENDPKNYPTVGDNAIICCGAQVLGPVVIGDDVIIGANAVVMQDVSSRHTAVGIRHTHFPLSTHAKPKQVDLR